MTCVFEQDGLRLAFPDTWQLDRQQAESRWTVFLQSRCTAFFMVSFDADMPDINLMAQTALEALREEYEDVEAEDCVESVGGQPTVGYNLRFFALDLTNTGWARSFYGGSGSFLLYWQANDLDLDEALPVLEAIAASVTVSED